MKRRLHITRTSWLQEKKHEGILKEIKMEKFNYKFVKKRVIELEATLLPSLSKKKMHSNPYNTPSKHPYEENVAETPEEQLQAAINNDDFDAAATDLHVQQETKKVASKDNSGSGGETYESNKSEPCSFDGHLKNLNSKMKHNPYLLRTLQPNPKVNPAPGFSYLDDTATVISGIDFGEAYPEASMVEPNAKEPTAVLKVKTNPKETVKAVVALHSAGDEIGTGVSKADITQLPVKKPKLAMKAAEPPKKNELSKEASVSEGETVK